MKQIRNSIALAIAIASVACGKSEVASNAIAPLPSEVGMWRSSNGSTLYLADNGYTYTPSGSAPISGDYTAEGGVVKMADPNGGDMVAEVSGATGPLTFKGQSFTKS